MRIDIMTLFPDAIDAMMQQSIIGRAQERGYIQIVDPPDPGIYHQQADAGGRLPLRRGPGGGHAG